jgi:hypothetical protein
LPGKNALAFLGSSSATKKSFMTLAPGVNVIKLFSFVAKDEAKYARVFVPGNHFPV